MSINDIPARVLVVDKEGRLTPESFRIINSIGDPQMLAVTASPFIFNAPKTGHFLMVGGAYTSIVKRKGINLNYGDARTVPASSGDIFQLTYTVLPTVYFVPQ